MDMITSHPDLGTKGGVYFWLSQQEFDRLNNIAREKNVSVTELIKKMFVRELSASDTEIVPAKREPHKTLSPRELEVAECVAQGLMNKEIADRMFIAESSVKNYVHCIFNKLDIRNREEIAVWYTAEFKKK